MILLPLVGLSCITLIASLSTFNGKKNFALFHYVILEISFIKASSRYFFCHGAMVLVLDPRIMYQVPIWPILCLTLSHHTPQLCVDILSPTIFQWISNLRPLNLKSSTLPLSHCTPHISFSFALWSAYLLWKPSFQAIRTRSDCSLISYLRKKSGHGL